MFKFKLITFILLFLLMFTFQNCAEIQSGNTPTKEERREDEEATFYSFGFYGDGLTSQLEDYYTATSSNSNTHWVFADINWGQELSWENDKEERLKFWRHKLNRVRLFNNKAIIDMRFLFEPSVKIEITNGGSSIEQKFHPPIFKNSECEHCETNYLKTYENIKSLFKEFDDVIVGFYLFDEPYTRNRSYLSASRYSQVNALSDLEKEESNQYVSSVLSELAALIKKDFSEKKLLTSFTFKDLNWESAQDPNSKIEIPSDIDLVGVDCYFTYKFYISPFDACSEENLLIYMENLNSLRKRSNIDQEFILFLDGFLNNLTQEQRKAENLLLLQDELIERNKFWLKFQDKYPVSAFYIFKYQSLQDNTGIKYYGVQHLPKLKVYFEDVYKRLNAKKP